MRRTCAMRRYSRITPARACCNWLVEGEGSAGDGLTTLRLACVDDDAQGETVEAGDLVLATPAGATGPEWSNSLPGKIFDGYWSVVVSGAASPRETARTTPPKGSWLLISAAMKNSASLSQLREPAEPTTAVAGISSSTTMTAIN
jgi:hypothetical protein